MGKKRVEVEATECGTCEGQEACPEVPKGAEAPVSVEGKVRKEKAPAAPAAPAKYTFVKLPGKEDKNLPKQATQILEILKENDGPMDKADLLEKMAAVIETRQPIERILGFYQPRLLANGFFSVAK